MSREPGPAQSSLALYVLTDCCLLTKGWADTECQDLALKLQEFQWKEGASCIGVQVQAWLLIFKTLQNHAGATADTELDAFRTHVENTLATGTDLLELVRAEVNFALGFSWERCKEYDIEKAFRYYQKSEGYYIHSGARSEMDRLMNTWGHCETLVYALADAEYHLGLARRFRELRSDKMSLTYTYGVLGDLYARTGDFDLAISYYDSDIALLHELGVEHQLPGVICKKGEAMIRNGLLESNEDVTAKGIALCADAEKMGGAQAGASHFFCVKGQLKGWLGLVLRRHSSPETDEYLKFSRQLLDRISAEGSYQEAILKRLQGRFYGLSGRVHEAQECLRESANLFQGMIVESYGLAYSLQSLASRLEAHLYRTADSKRATLDDALRGQLKNIAYEMSGTLGAASLRARDLLSDLDRCENVRKDDQARRLEILWKFVWFLES